MSTGAVESKQAQAQSAQGGNVVNKAPDKNVLYQPPAFMGKSGQSDNQSTNRAKGST